MALILSDEDFSLSWSALWDSTNLYRLLEKAPSIPEELFLLRRKMKIWERPMSSEHIFVTCSPWYS